MSEEQIKASESERTKKVLRTTIIVISFVLALGTFGLFLRNQVTKSFAGNGGSSGQSEAYPSAYTMIRHPLVTNQQTGSFECRVVHNDEETLVFHVLFDYKAGRQIKNHHSTATINKKTSDGWWSQNVPLQSKGAIENVKFRRNSSNQEIVSFLSTRTHENGVELPKPVKIANDRLVSQ
jgi:hypothetical protein